MTASVKHRFVSAVPDGDDESLIRPSNWNDEHDVTGIESDLGTPDGEGYILASSLATGGSPTSVADVLSTAYPTGGVATGTTNAGSSHGHAFTGDATSVVQPYITCRFWKRTA